MSEIKVNKISPRTNCGTVTLGDSGDTFTIPAGATITNNGTAAGFGATGAASWDTTVKTSGFTAVSGVGYFVNTTGGAISVNLPAGTAGDVVAFKDYAKTWDTNNVTLVQNGSDKIGGSTVNAVLNTEGLAVTLVFIDSTQGWLVTDSGLQSESPTPAFLTATGGTITTVCTDYKVHTFTGPGTFTVCSVGNAAGSNSIDYLVIAGGGGGGVGPSSANYGSGAGAGGYRESSGTVGSFSASPLGACVAALPVSATGYPITIGAGGAGGGPPSAKGTSGSPSSFAASSTITSAGGGGGASNGFCSGVGQAGGSGGGAAGGVPGGGTVGAGNTPPVSPPQGQPGGLGAGTAPAGGGGGATVAGTAGTPTAGGPGGAGATSSINGTPTARAGGGAGNGSPTDGTGGAGGGGSSGTNGTANTGGGGGGSHTGYTSGIGGSGIVIIRYKFQ